VQLFYAPNITEQIHFLPEDESKHLIRVLRKQYGDLIDLTDGHGHYYQCKIADDHPKKCGLEVISKTLHENPIAREIHIAIAPTKNNDRMEWFIEKAVEIGVTSITPIICKNSERSKLKRERMLKVAISAMKQSNRFYLPTISELTPLSEFIKSDNASLKLIAHCEDTDKSYLESMSLPVKTSILIGPEGDFDISEISDCIESGYVPVSLGNSRLRTETAGIVACTYLNRL